MKAIIYCTENESAATAFLPWTAQFFPGHPAYLLPIANKPYLDYVLDFCVLCGIREVRLIFNLRNAKIEEYLEDGARFGLAISYANAGSGISARKLIARNRDFCRGESLFFLQGLLFLEYDKNNLPRLEIGPDRLMAARDGAGFCFFCGERLLEDLPEDLFERAEPLPLPIASLGSVRDYYDWNMKVVHHLRDHYNLPGYGDSADFMVGQNVQIPKSAEVVAPVILGNSVQLGNQAKIGPGVIIGSHALIDNQAVLEESVVFGNSYVGCNLEISHKICYRNLMIDPINGIKMDVIDELILTELVKQGIWRCPFMQRVTAFLMLIFYAIPFFLLRPFLKIRKVDIECFMDQQTRKKLKLRLYISPPESLACRLFLKLSLDRYHLLPLVLTGSLRLVGSYILEATRENARSLRQFPDYAPGIFSYSEYMEHDHEPFQREIDELYYMYHATFWSNFKILKGILLRNLLKQDITKPMRY